MRNALVLVALLLGACAHSDVGINSRSVSAPGSTLTSSGASIQVSGSAMAAVLAAGVIVAGTLSERDDPPARYHSLSEWFSGAPAPEMEPGRKVSEQDCTKPLSREAEMRGNLRCR